MEEVFKEIDLNNTPQISTLSTISCKTLGKFLKLKKFLFEHLISFLDFEDLLKLRNREITKIVKKLNQFRSLLMSKLEKYML